MSEPPALWRDLRRFTSARVALGRVGNGMPTAAHLDFQAAHAAARDAVHAELDIPALAASLGGMPRIVRSLCPDRRAYLVRPDLGRALHQDDRAALQEKPAPDALIVVICDGLSATAVQRHAAPLLAALSFEVGPVLIAANGRVALGDAVGEALGAAAVIVLIGERPGLSSPDSLGAYLTWNPRVGRTDADRNCISNIRGQGLSVADAAGKLAWLVGEMRRLGLSGVALKDDQPAANALETQAGARQGVSTSVVAT